MWRERAQNIGAPKTYGFSSMSVPFWAHQRSRTAKKTVSRILVCVYVNVGCPVGLFDDGAMDLGPACTPPDAFVIG